MLNIVIPMAGRGSRFVEAGYLMPKPLIDVHGHYMIECVIKNLTPQCEHRFIFICQEEHIKKYELKQKLEMLAPGCAVVTVDHITEGAACTVLLAERYIDTDDELMIANSDQYVDICIDDYLCVRKDFDGLIMTMPADNPKWSFVKCDADGKVELVREKEVISNQATVGIYNYKHGSDFVRYAKQMIAKNIRVNNEFYVAPVYNEMIADGNVIITSDIGNSMYGIGVPDDLNAFLKLEVSRKIFS